MTYAEKIEQATTAPRREMMSNETYGLSVTKRQAQLIHDVAQRAINDQAHTWAQGFEPCEETCQRTADYLKLIEETALLISDWDFRYQRDLEKEEAQ